VGASLYDVALRRVNGETEVGLRRRARSNIENKHTRSSITCLAIRRGETSSPRSNYIVQQIKIIKMWRMLG